MDRLKNEAEKIGKVLDIWTDEKGKEWEKVIVPCHRCGGDGKFSYNKQDKDICYACKGAGIEEKVKRVLTEKEKIYRERAKQRKEEKKMTNLQNEYDREDEKIKKIYGFVNTDIIYIVINNNSYKLKDDIKKDGGKWNKKLNHWIFFNNFFSTKYVLYKINYDDLFYTEKVWSDECYTRATVDENKLYKIYNMIEESGVYFGNIKDKIEIEVKYQNCNNFDTEWGESYIYTFTKNNYIFIWKTTKFLENIDEGMIVKLKGTIKDYKIYNGKKQTVLTRCKILKIENKKAD